MTASAPTREELIDCCELAAKVPVEKWSNRDTAGAVRQLGEVWALLKAGVEFSANLDDRLHVWWVNTSFPGFQAFEYGRSDPLTWDDERFYVPTIERVRANPGRDWY